MSTQEERDAALAADGRFQRAFEEGKLTWTKITFRCEDCGKICYASQESIDASRAQDPEAYADVTDADVVSGFSWCLSCAWSDTPVAGEHVDG